MKCNKNTGMYNLYPAGCIVTPDVTAMFVFVPYYKADGTANGIDLNAPFNETVIDALINQTNKNIRWYLTDKVNNFVTDRADPNTEAIDGVNHITSQGVRTMSGDFLGSSTELAKKINGNNHTDIGVFLIDVENGITGVVTRDGFLDPIKLERNAFGKVVFPTESTIFKVSYSSTWSRLIRDGDVRTLCYDDHHTNILDKKGLIDASSRNTIVASATTVKTSIFIPNGHALGIDFTGLVLADFTITNTTTNTPVVITAMVEDPNGTYELTYSAQTTADLGSISVVKSGFEFTETLFTFA